MPFSFLWISGFRSVESLWHYTGKFLVWFSKNGSVSDPNIWREVSLIGDVCGSTSFLCLNSGVWVLLLGTVVEFLWISIKWDSWVCCQTTSVIVGSLVVSGLSIAALEWRRSTFISNSGLQLEAIRSTEFDRIFGGPDSIFLVFCAGEAVY